MVLGDKAESIIPSETLRFGGDGGGGYFGFKAPDNSVVPTSYYTHIHRAVRILAAFKC